MVKKKGNVDETGKWNLKIIINQLSSMVKEGNDYYNANTLSSVCSHLQSYCTKNKQIKYAKTFREFGKLFTKINKSNRQRLGIIEVLADKKEDFVYDKEIEGKKYTSIIDFKKYKGEEVAVTFWKDKTVSITFAGISIQVPLRKFKQFEEVKPNP